MKKINSKNILFSIICLILSTNLIFAGCGSCQVQGQVSESKKSSSFITNVPESGEINGFVMSSCGKCNFGYKKKRSCSLTINIADTVYPVQGANIRDHGNPHSEEGFCNAVRVAYVSGKIKKNTFYSDSFTLIESPK